MSWFIWFLFRVLPLCPDTPVDHGLAVLGSLSLKSRNSDSKLSGCSGNPWHNLTMILSLTNNTSCMHIDYHIARIIKYDYDILWLYNHVCVECQIPWPSQDISVCWIHVLETSGEMCWKLFWNHLGLHIWPSLIDCTVVSNQESSSIIIQADFAKPCCEHSIHANTPKTSIGEGMAKNGNWLVFQHGSSKSMVKLR